MSKGGGSSTTKVELPDELMDAAKANLQIADEAASLGYVPYNGPSVAGFAPQQLDAMQATDQAAAAFGMPNQMGTPKTERQRTGGQGYTEAQMYRDLLGMPAPNDSAMGISGFNAMPAYNQAVNRIRPGQRELIASMVRDPNSGGAAINTAMPAQSFIDPTRWARSDAQRQAFIGRRANYTGSRDPQYAAGTRSNTEGKGKPNGDTLGTSAARAQAVAIQQGWNSTYAKMYMDAIDDGDSESEAMRKVNRAIKRLEK